MNDDYTKDEDQDIEFDPKKIKDSLLMEDDPLLDETLPIEDEEIDELEDDFDYTADNDDDEDY